MRESAPYTDCDLKREDLAKMLATNYNNVADAIKECSSGQTLSEFLDSWRLKHAAKMLADQDEPIGLVAEMSGFQSRGHFNTLFREKYKMTPSEYRRTVKEGNS
jgi:AraC-like DNA-binding protein